MVRSAALMTATVTGTHAGIRVCDITREFKRQRRRPGLGGAVRGLFAPEYDVLTAVDRISFDIEPGEVVGTSAPTAPASRPPARCWSASWCRPAARSRWAAPSPTASAWPTPATSSCSASAPSSGGTSRCRTPSRSSATCGIPLPDYERALARFADILATDEFMDVAVRQLSLGQRMRADFCCAMLHDPDFIFLDEPTIGLDVVGQGAHPPVHPRGQPHARQDRHPDDARHGRHREALRPRDRHRQGPDHVRRRPRCAEAALRGRQRVTCGTPPMSISSSRDGSRSTNQR